MYCVFDLGKEIPQEFFTENSDIKYSLIGIDTPTPYLQLNNYILKGELQETLGTDIILETSTELTVVDTCSDMRGDHASSNRKGGSRYKRSRIPTTRKSRRKAESTEERLDEHENDEDNSSATLQPKTTLNLLGTSTKKFKFERVILSPLEDESQNGTATDSVHDY
ncbi:hypothetical protein BKA69DRAFT_1077676 [Paraphysoderma sedebokerense]|nr:hypothetical protein BKA69DRAFT_1085737 [Paraphysoderma sedebokerense]KAI9140784.1 hypothetical protein BKA69DRAFT_1077676 [Paraphysoderma sedebokerense]